MLSPGKRRWGGQYLALKNALIDSYGRTEASKHTQLIALTKEGALGDRKPMDFLMYMRSLSGSDYETWEKAILLNAMPVEVRTVLSISDAANNK